MALLDNYTTEIIFNDSIKIGKKEKDIELNINCNDKISEMFKNYEWLIVNPKYKKGIIKLLRYFLLQRRAFSEKFDSSQLNFILFLTHITEVYKTNYYFDFIKNLIINYAVTTKDIDLIIEYYSAYGIIRKIKLLEFIFSIPKKSVKYRNPLIRSCIGNNIQLRDYFYRKIPFKKEKASERFCILAFRNIYFVSNLKQMKWFIKTIVPKCMDKPDNVYMSIFSSAWDYSNVNIIKWLIKENIITKYQLPISYYSTIPRKVPITINKNKNKISKMIANYFIGCLEGTIKFRFASDMFEFIIRSKGFLKNTRLLERILLLIQQEGPFELGIFFECVLENLFSQINGVCEYNNKIFDKYFKMFVKCGIFKVGVNNEIIGTTVFHYNECINKVFMNIIGNKNLMARAAKLCGKFTLRKFSMI
jgi:hypothetical protein